MEWWVTFTAWLCSKLNQVKIYLKTTQRMNGSKEMGPVAFTRTGYQVSRSWPSTAAGAKESARWNWETVEDLFWGKVMGKKKKLGEPCCRNGEGNGNPLQYSCLGKPMDRGPWWGSMGQSTGLQRVRHDGVHTYTWVHTHTHTHCRRAHAVWLWAGHLTSLILLLFW